MLTELFQISIDKSGLIAYNNRARVKPLRIDVALMCEST